MDFALLNQVVEELSVVLPGARVDKVSQGSDHTLLLSFHLKRKNYVLLLSADRSLSRMHLTSRKPAGAAAPAGFFLYLRKHLTGARLAGIGCLNEDRVAELRLARPGAEYRLILELTGSSANIILTDASYRILAVLFPTSFAETARRPLLAGLTYSPPGKEGKEKRPDAGPSASLLSSGQQGDFPANKTAEESFDRLTRERQEAALRGEIISLIRKAAARTGRRRQAVLQDLDAAEKADVYRRSGELLLANVHRIEKNAEQVELEGYDGVKMTVSLDPNVSVAKNAERYFRKYKKAKAGIGVIRERLRETEREAAFLTSLQAEIADARDVTVLSQIRSKLIEHGYAGGPGRPREDAKAAAAPFRKFEFAGWEILVGKSAAGNDYLTTKLARPEDLWLHAEGMPGSHVIVRNPKRREIAPEILMRAASLAAYFSKGRGSAKVPVAYTSAKFVKKPKGVKPGTVMLTARKTIMAAPEKP